MTTLRDVAKRAQTSISAVSAVLNGVGKHNIRVGTATRERIMVAARELGYTPNPVARSLVTRRTGTLGLVFPYSGAFVEQNPFCTQVMSGVMEAAVRAKYDLMFHTAIGDDWHTFDSEALSDPRVDGLILVLPNPNSPVVERFAEERIRRVAVVYEPCSPRVCAVNADDRQGGRLATEHLIALGHRKIAHLTGNPNVATTQPRIEGYLSALEAAGIEPDPALLIESGFDWHDGVVGMRRLLDLPKAQRPTAVFTANDLCAEGALRLLAERGLRAPDDVALVGFDDTWFAAMTRPPLTSVHMPIYEMGVLATEMLIALIEGRELPERQPVLPVSLTVRESSGPTAPR
jgi:LacI family transcriptional regulator